MSDKIRRPNAKATKPRNRRATTEEMPPDQVERMEKLLAVMKEQITAVETAGKRQVQEKEAEVAARLALARALRETHLDKLYRAKYTTFAKFCKHELPKRYNERYARRLVRWLEINEEIGPKLEFGPIPEGQTRQLDKLKDAAERSMVLEAVFAKTKGKLTAMVIREEIEARFPHLAKVSKGQVVTNRTLKPIPPSQLPPAEPDSVQVIKRNGPRPERPNEPMTIPNAESNESLQVDGEASDEPEETDQSGGQEDRQHRTGEKEATPPASAIASDGTGFQPSGGVADANTAALMGATFQLFDGTDYLVADWIDGPIRIQSLLETWKRLAIEPEPIHVRVLTQKNMIQNALNMNASAAEQEGRDGIQATTLTCRFMTYMVTLVPPGVPVFAVAKGQAEPCKAIG